MNSETSFFQWLDQFHFFLQSDGFNMIGFGIIVYLCMMWLALVIWVTRDAIHRSSSMMFQIIAIVLNIFLPVFGLIFYLILRPEKTLLEKYHEELEYRMLEGGEDICTHCTTLVKEGFSFCPSCGEQIHQTCGACKKAFSRRWHICPYCGDKKKTEKKTRKKKEGN